MDIRNLVNFNGELVDFFEDRKQSDAICPSCGYEFQNYIQTGRLGCSKCYDVFHDAIMREVSQWKT